MKISWKPFRKIVAAALSGVSATGVVAFLTESGVTDVPTGIGALIATAAAVIAGYVVPEKRTKPVR